MLYTETIISGLLLLAYIFIATKQGRYIKILKETNDQIKSITTVQSTLISDFQAHRELFNMEDIKQLVELKLENQRLKLSNEYADKEKSVVQEYLVKLDQQERTISTLSDRAELFRRESQTVRNLLKELEDDRVQEELKMDEVNQRIKAATTEITLKTKDWLKNMALLNPKDPSSPPKGDDHLPG
ncbi:MAG TPA: hypothetical protein VGQ53_18980 [Chitinophagaceae bacterium]|jgi:hypothetical protein|nr:hypothetical protein [Chitinophagaceae bacterium]